MTLPVSLTLPQFRHEAVPLLAAARRAESLGYDGVFLFDHLYPLEGPRRPILEVTAALGAVAAVTDTARVGTLVMRAPARPPATTARVAWTGQAVSGGRLVLGLGGGDRLSAPEMDAYGLGFGSVGERLRRVRETVTALDDPALRLPAVPRPEVWIGGRLEAVRRLAAEVAEGWNAWGGSPARLAAEAADVRRWARRDITVSWGGAVLLAPDESTLRELVSARGGTEGIVAGTPKEVTVTLRQMQAAGADQLVLSLFPQDPQAAAWELFAEEVRPQLA